jgi:hypothetical protein
VVNVLASYFVLEEISELVGNQKALRRVLEKFRTRYPDDVEFASLCELYDSYLASYDEKLLSDFNDKLKGLMSARKHESGGGGSLPLSDRRSMREDRSRR